MRNTPVIHRNKQIGFLQSVKLDDEQKRVQAFVIARGLKGKCILRADDVTTFSKEFIIAEAIEKYDRRFDVRSSFFVIDTDGLMLGKISDYAIDEDTLRVYAVEVMRGYLPGQCRDRVWFYSYSISEGKIGEIIVPAFIQLSQREWKAGENACGFQP